MTVMAVVEAIGDIESLAIWREHDAARIVANRNPCQHVIGGRRKIVDERLAPGVHRFQQTSNVNDGDALGPGRSQENFRLVGSDRDSPRQSVVAVEFVNRDWTVPPTSGQTE